MPISFAKIDLKLLTVLDGYLVITPNERLAREYKSAYDEAQAENGREAWTSLKCLSLKQFLFREFQTQQDFNSVITKIIPPAELMLRFQNTAPTGAEHLTPTAVEAWELVRRYNIDLSDRAMNAGRSKLFANWVTRVNQQLKPNEAIEADIATLLKSKSAGISEPILLIAFEHLTPSEVQLLNRYKAASGVYLLEDNGQVTVFEAEQLSKARPKTTPKKAPLMAFDSFAQELSAAANWSKAVLQENSNNRIGIVIPDLVQNYAMVQRQFAVTLNPQTGSAMPKFDMSGGTSLSIQPVWVHARTLLTWCHQPADPNAIARLAHSPFLELPWCESLNTNWPSFLRRNVSILELSRLEIGVGALNLLAQLERMPQKATIRDWIFIVRELLQNANWPRLENINSIQYQAAQSIFAQLDVLANLQNKSKISFNRALEFIDFNLDQSSFAPQRKASAIQILGLLETTGLTFSHLWVCGMSAANFPSVSQLNPFIPRAIAQKSGLPRSAQDQELEFARRTLNRWLNVEAELNFSYTRLDKNSPQLPSNLLLDAITPQDGLSADNQKQMPFAADHSLRNPIMVKQGVVLETSDDGSGTAITDPHIAGGTTTLKAHASCPFKAYAMFRLKLKQPREAKDFLDAVDRGNSLHKVLENLMRVYDDSNAITKITSAEINKQCGLVLKQYRGLPESFIANELDRISELVKQWLELEKKRKPFKINAVEEKFNLTLEGLTFSIKIDRIDTIDDQNVVIDYKSSSNSVTGAISEPLTDPQLPAYSLVPKKIAGVYFASISNKEVTLDGIALETGKLVAAKTKGFAIKNPDGTNIYSKESQIQWPDKVHTWQLELTQIAREIALGNAQVAPKKSACKHCHLTSFCRINDP